MENPRLLIEHITEKAAGVFLWVFLVTQRLRNGLAEYDCFSDLQRRLDNIPADLEPFFKQILESVEPFYHNKMATTLRLALATPRPVHIVIYSFHDKEYEDTGYAMKPGCLAWNEQQADQLHSQITRRINARCRGLLEVNKASKNVEFLYRTVRDYLGTNEMSHYLDTKSRKGYDVHLSILKAFTAYVQYTKNTVKHIHDTQQLEGTLQQAFFHASKVIDNACALELLDAIENHTSFRHIFQEVAVQMCSTAHICHSLGKDSNYFAGLRKPVLCYCIDNILGVSTRPDSPTSAPLPDTNQMIKLLRFLLEFGFDPHQIFACEDMQETSPWNELLRKTILFKHNSNTSRFKVILGLDVIPVMLSHRADPNVPTWNDDNVSFPTGFAGFLWSLLLIKDLSCQKVCMDTLDSILAAGADLNLHYTQKNNNADIDGFNEIYHRLGSFGLGYFLGEIKQYAPIETNAQGTMIAAVTEKLLAVARDLGCDIERYFQLYNPDQLFTRTDMRDNLFCSFPSTHSTYSESPSKRRLEVGNEEQPQTKRSRFGSRFQYK